LSAAASSSYGSRAGGVPVVFTVFNRPDHTRKTFAAIRSYRPARLFIVADGPRPGNTDDVRRCAEVRDIVSEIDWPCEATRDYSETNLGCARRVSSGLTAAFEAVDRAIVLEDDCLASAEFFSFCAALLERYAETAQVWAVNGNSYQPQFRRGDGAYYFSRYPDSWGWATWRRAWQYYRHDLPFLESWLRSPRWRLSFPHKRERRFLEHIFRETAMGAIDSWGYRWMACVMHGEGLCAIPNANLVKNIGFGDDATHTRNVDFGYELTPLGSLEHPSVIRADDEADAYFRKKFGFEFGITHSLRHLARLALRKLR